MSPTPPSLRRNFSYALVGNVTYSACQWLSFVVLAKLGSAAIVGQFALGLALTAPIVIFANLSLATLIITDARREHPFGDYMAIRVITIVIAANVIVATTLYGGYSAETTRVVLLLGLAKLVDALSDIFLALLQQRERLDRVGVAFAVNGLMSLQALTIAMYLTHDATLAALASVFGSLVALGFVAIPSARAVLAQGGVGSWRPLLPTFHLKAMKRLVLLAAPLGVVGLLLSVNSSIPRLVIQHFEDEAALGIFAALASLMLAGNTVAAALSQAAAPRLAQYFAAGRLADFRWLLLRLCALGAALGVGGMLVAALAGKPLLTLIYRPEYAEHLDVFLWLMGVAAVNYVLGFAGVAVTAMRIFTRQVPLHIINTVVIAALSWVLIKRYSLLGGAIALLLSALWMLVGYGALAAGRLFGRDEIVRNPPSNDAI